MALLPLFLGLLNVTTARINMPGTGVWVADLEVDLPITNIVPSGRSVLTVGTTPLTGTIDPRMSGRFGSKGHVRLVGGGNGWDKVVKALHIQNPFGVISQAVFAATAAEVGETIVDTSPSRLGKDFVRTAGPASRVLAGRAWYVDPTGVTIAGPRVPLPPSPDLQILTWDPKTRRAEIAVDGLVLPGTLLVDTRFGTATVRDVEQTFGADGARAIAWCETADSPSLTPSSSTSIEPPGARLVRALSLLAREATGAPYLKRYRYRIVIQGGDKRVILQLVQRSRGVPEILKDVEVWPGVASVSTTFKPGTEVLVVFIDGDSAQPIVVGVAPDAPSALVLEIGAELTLVGGISAAAVARASELVAWATNVNSALNGLGAPVAPLAPSVASTRLFAG